MLTSTTNKVQYTIAYPFGSTYPVTFSYWLGSEIHAVLSFPAGTDDLPLVLNTDFSLSAPGATGTLTRLSDWNHAAVRLTIYRELINDQQTDYRNGEAVDMDMLEQDFDRAAARDQQIAEPIARTVTIPITDDAASLELPAKAERASTLFGWDADGQPIPGAGGVIAASPFMATLLDDLTLAAAQKTLVVCGKGYQAISLTHFTDTAEPSIAAGSKVEIGGALYEFLADEAGTGWGGIGASNFVYILLTPSGASVSWSYTTTAPTWDTAKQGWYTGANRVIGGLYKDSGSLYTAKYLLGNNQSLFESYRFMGKIERILTGSGNWTVPAGVYRIRVTCVGGGGGGSGGKTG
jgi:hypothetical protein